MGIGKPGLPVYPTRRSVTGLGVMGLGAPTATNPGRVRVRDYQSGLDPGHPLLQFYLT